MTTIADYITTSRATVKKPKADINERWQSRIVAAGMDRRGRAGADDYISAYGKGIAAPKVIGFAVKAELEGANDMAARFWEIAYTLATGLSATATAGNGGAPTPSAPAPAKPQIPHFPSALQPGTISTMQPTDALRPQTAYILDSSYWGQAKRDGNRDLAIVTEDAAIHQSRSLSIMGSLDSRLDQAMQAAAKILGPFILDGERTYLDVDGGEHRTGSQAIQTNTELGQPTARPVTVFCAFKALFATGSSLLDSTEAERIEAAEGIVPHIAEALAKLAPATEVRIEMLATARTTAEKQALADKQKGESREGEIWVRHDTTYVAGKTNGKSEPTVRTKYLMEMAVVITTLTPTTAAGRPFGAIEVSKVEADGRLTPMGSAGTGFDAATAAEIKRRHDAAPGTVMIEVRSQGLTEGKKLWHARFIGFVATK
jgi:ATP-dependent DNA ligase